MMNPKPAASTLTGLFVLFRITAVAVLLSLSTFTALPTIGAEARRMGTALFSHSQQVHDPSEILTAAATTTTTDTGTDTNNTTRRMSLFRHFQKGIRSDPSESLTTLHNTSTATPTTTSTENEKSYKWSVKEDDYVLAHNAIRKEIAAMQQLIDSRTNLKQCKNLESWELDSVQVWWKGHEAHVRKHCTNENDFLHPAILERVLEFPVEQMKKNHRHIYQELDELSAITETLSTPKATAVITNGDDVWMELSKLWKKYTDTLTAHFLEVENESVVPVRQAFSSAEWGPVIREFFDRGAKELLASMIYCMGQDDFRKNFMRKRGIPGFVWNLSFKKSLNYYDKSMAKHMDALTNGIVPT